MNSSSARRHITRAAVGLLVLVLVPPGALAQCSGYGQCSDDMTCVIGCSCRNCHAGHYCRGGSWDYDAGFCSDVEYSCPAGKYSGNRGNSASSDCRTCPSGQYSTYSGSSDCDNCASGRYSSSGSSSCINCARGRSSSSGSSSCTACSSGRYQGSSGSSSCRSCSSGQYSSSGAVSCSSCAGGQYSSSSSSSCSSCAAGRSSGAGSGSCSSCSSGQYQPSTGSSSCRSCAAGKRSGSGSTSCIDCATGQYQSSSGRSSCTVCSPGRVQPATGSSSGCSQCAPGRSASSGQASCTDCVSGRYQASAGSGSCDYCPGGQFQHDEAQVTCVQCAAGRYAPNTGYTSVSSCRACVAGRYTPAAGASSCITCASGRAQPRSGQDACGLCPLGRRTNIDGSDCTFDCESVVRAIAGPEGCDLAPDDARTSQIAGMLSEASGSCSLSTHPIATTATAVGTLFQPPPPPDFCVDPGNAMNNPDGAIYECRHPCISDSLSSEDQNAAGCHGDNSGNRHADQICVLEGVYEPGEMQPWGAACCEWCGDDDGDGSPDYQGCCEGMRADGEMGCEDMRCEWTCNGINCEAHGEDQPTCEANSGVWEISQSCADSMSMQGMMAMQFADMGFPENFASTIWLGDFGDVCCTGYEPASMEGSCDNDIDVYNQVVACDEDPGCDEGPLVGGFSGECFRCLVGNDAESGPPPIEPCLTGGVQNLNNASSGRRLQLTGQLSVGKVGGARAVASLSDIANSSARRLQSDTACQVTTVIDEWSYLGGDIVFADGYDHYADCRWLLDGSSRGGNSRIALRFTSFDTETNFDFVDVYDGDSTSSPRLAHLSGHSLPDTAYYSSGSSLLVRFTSDGSVSNEGFEASYSCSPTVTQFNGHTAQLGILVDHNSNHCDSVGGVCGLLVMNFEEQSWGAVCDDSFNSDEAAAVCQDLGFDPSQSSSSYDTSHGDGYFAADDINCPSGASSLQQCTMSTPYTDNCVDSETVGIVCGASAPAPPPLAPPPPGWTRVDNRHCAGSSTGAYSTRQAAESACVADPSCWGLYDSSCNGEGDFATCPSNGHQPSDSGSCLFSRPGFSSGGGTSGTPNSAPAPPAGGQSPPPPLSTATACTNRPCLNSGSCENVPGGFVCSCLNGFNGTRCERAPGCTDLRALNFDYSAIDDDGSCIYPSESLITATGTAREEICLEYTEQHHPSWTEAVWSCPQLPETMWPTDDLPGIIGGATTPCNEVPTIAQVCQRWGEDVHTWTRHDSSLCSGESIESRFRDRFSAEMGCALSTTCTGIYDPGCDGQGTFSTCTTHESMLSSTTSGCVYSMSGAVGSSTISLSDRAREWLNLASDYVMQTGDQNAAVIARQLCDENGFEAVACVQHPQSELEDLRELTRQSCVLANHLEKRISLGSILDTNQLQPLTYDRYDQVFEQFSTHMQDDLMQGMAEAQTFEIMATVMDESARNAGEMSRIASQREQNDQAMAESYLSVIGDVQQRITAAQESMGINQQRLASSISSRQQAQQQALDDAIAESNRAAQIAEVQAGVRLATGIFTALLAAPTTGGLSMVGAVVSTYNWFTSEENEEMYTQIQEQGRQFLTQGWQLYQDLQTDCETLDVDECNAMLEEIADTMESLERARASMGMLQDIMRLNAQLTVHGGTVTAADLPNLACLSMRLDSVDAAFQVQLFHDSAEHESTDIATAQLFSLIQSKVELMADFYNTKLAAQDQAIERDMLQSRAIEASANSDRAEEYAAAVHNFYEARLHAEQLLAAQMLMCQIRAFEFMFLSTYSRKEIFLSSLRDNRLAPANMLDILVRERSDLTAQWIHEASSNNNCGSSFWSTVEISLADLPGTTFAETGSVTLSIDPPTIPGYSHLVYGNTPRVFLVGLQGEVPVHLTFWKKGISTMLDEDAQPWTFTHEQSDPPLVFAYSPIDCTVVGTAGNTATNTNLCNGNAVYMNPSPYGVWRISVDNRDRLDLSTVTSIKFAFNVAGKPLTAPAWQGGARYVFDGQEALATREVTLACLDGSAPSGSTQLTPPPPPTITAGSENPDADEGPSLCSMESFLSLLDEGLETACSTPDACPPDCFDVFGPFATQCYAWAQTEPHMVDVVPAMEVCVDTQEDQLSATADCDGIIDEIQTQGTFAVGGVCCADERSCDANGTPTYCSSGCADVMVPFFERCSGWIKSSPEYSGLVPLVVQCEDTMFGSFTGSAFSRRCSRAEKGHFLTFDLPAACCGSNDEFCPDGELFPPMPRQCTTECAQVFEQFYAECHPTFDNTDEGRIFSGFLAQCQGMAAGGPPALAEPCTIGTDDQDRILPPYISCDHITILLGGPDSACASDLSTLAAMIPTVDPQTEVADLCMATCGTCLPSRCEGVDDEDGILPPFLPCETMTIMLGGADAACTTDIRSLAPLLPALDPTTSVSAICRATCGTCDEDDSGASHTTSPGPPQAPHETSGVRHSHPCMDIDGDGWIGVNDLLSLLAAFGAPAVELHTGFSHGDVVDVIDLLNLLPDYGRDISGGCFEAAVGETNDYLDAVVTTLAASVPGYTTYTLTASLHADAANNIYAIEGTADGPMSIPAAYQVAAPFGTDIGGVQPAFFPIANNAARGYAEFDSWLTIGLTDGSDPNALATIGIDFGSWTDSTALLVDDGSVFYMDPNSGPGGDVVVAQLTVRSGTSGNVAMGMQGHATGGGDWDVHHVLFTY